MQRLLKDSSRRLRQDGVKTTGHHHMIAVHCLHWTMALYRSYETRTPIATGRTPKLGQDVVIVHTPSEVAAMSCCCKPTIDTFNKSGKRLSRHLPARKGWAAVMQLVDKQMSLTPVKVMDKAASCA